MAYPNDIFDPREIENMPNVVYDADKKTVFFAEDINAADDEIVAIEETLGTFESPYEVPEGGYLNHYNGLIANIYQQIQSIRPLEGRNYPTSFVFPAPLGIEWPLTEPVMLATGGQFTIVAPPTTEAYRVFASVGLNVFNQPVVFLSYLKESTWTFVSPPIYPLGATIQGHDEFHWRFEFNYNDAPLLEP